jgi:Family of unknown function (DUF5675)
MELRLRRFEFGTNYTIGKLYVDGIYYCFTLEDKVREGVKVDGQTAIPYGTYTVVIDHSNRFNRDLPHVLNVPGFEGIRIHTGNTDADTEGCILVGTTWAGKDFVGNSKFAFDPLFKKMKKADKITLEIYHI